MREVGHLAEKALVTIHINNVNETINLVPQFARLTLSKRDDDLRRV